MVGADSSGSLPSPKVLRNSTISKKDFVYEAVTLSGHLFHGVLLSFSLNNVEPYNPLHKCRVWAVPFSLIAYSGNLIRFLFLRVLRYFSSPGYPPRHRRGLLAYTKRGYPIRTPPGHRILAPNRRLSRPYTSFFGTTCQGIRCVLYLSSYLVFSVETLKKDAYILFTC